MTRKLPMSGTMNGQISMSFRSKEHVDLSKVFSTVFFLILIYARFSVKFNAHSKYFHFRNDTQVNLTPLFIS
jgi:hypothetical protein